MRQERSRSEGVTPAAIARLVAAGWSHERIRDEYPGGEEPDIAAALRHERQDRRASGELWDLLEMGLLL